MHEGVIAMAVRNHVMLRLVGARTDTTDREHPGGKRRLMDFRQERGQIESIPKAGRILNHDMRHGHPPGGKLAHWRDAMRDILNIIIISWQNASPWIGPLRDAMPSSLPRIEFADLPATLAAILKPRVKRLGYLGEFFKCAAHQPDALAAFIGFTEASQEGLSKQLVEVIALTCTAWTGNSYERNQHERLCVRLGFGHDWVAAVNALDPEANALLTPEERSVQRLTLTVLGTQGRSAGLLFEETLQRMGARLAMAILMIIGRYVTHSLIVNTLELEPPVPSIFEDGFTGD